jgi:tRNA(Ile)-lysidine synthase
LPFVSGRPGKPLTGNIEQAARLARYEFLLTTAESLDAFCILTGHTIDDQAETFLINLLRGSGLKGLSAMKIERGFHVGSEVRLVRPLLRWARRADTEAFCADLKIRYMEDSMNDDTSFNRVRIRKEVLPLLGEFNPNIVETLNRTAETLLESHSAITYLIGDNTTLNDAVSTEKLKLSVLVQLPPEVRRVIVRSWLSNNRVDLRGITNAHITAVVALAVSRKSGKTVELPRGGKIVKGNGWLELE